VSGDTPSNSAAWPRRRSPADRSVDRSMCGNLALLAPECLDMGRSTSRFVAMSTTVEYLPPIDRRPTLVRRSAVLTANHLRRSAARPARGGLRLGHADRTMRPPRAATYGARPSSASAAGCKGPR
jgi:hypothetical protein